MKKNIIGRDSINRFEKYLVREEKSAATIEKYMRDVRAFSAYADKKILTKELVSNYKNYLLDSGYAPRSVNSMLASIHSFLEFAGKSECKVKFLKIQRNIYCEKERSLSKSEYRRLLKSAEGNEKLSLVMQTICATGIRVSELKYFTVERVRLGKVVVNLKAKIRTILVPNKLRKMLLDYAKKEKIRFGEIFLTKKGKSLDRKTIWAAMKALCKSACVNKSKVFPHNLRKLFAKTFYSHDKDIARLADVLGHSSIDTTRIYIMTTSDEHMKRIECLGLLL